jgi:hypothetical protein
MVLSAAVADECLIPRRSGRLTIGRNITLTLTLSIVEYLIVTQLVNKFLRRLRIFRPQVPFKVKLGGMCG